MIEQTKENICKIVKKFVKLEEKEKILRLEKAKFDEEKKALQEEVKRLTKLNKDNLPKMKEVAEQLSGCREEMKMYVEMNTKLREENNVLKRIKEAQDILENDGEPEIIELERESSDISDEEAANVYLRNKKVTGTRPKNNLNCTHCNFVAKDETLLRGHMSMHQPGNGNYENGILSYKDGYKCNRCGEAAKTMGLIKRHMKTQHNINLTVAPPHIDGARSQQNQKKIL